LLCALSLPHHIRVRTISGQTRVSITGDGVGGFAMIHGDPGTGKSVALRLLADRLAHLPDITVGAINHPQSNLADFYREMGDIFGVPLRPHNRWGGFKALREAWLVHLETTRRRAILLVDEAQEMSPAALPDRHRPDGHPGHQERQKRVVGGGTQKGPHQ
jgi:hypothetical protein